MPTNQDQDSDEEAPNFQDLLKLPPSTGSHFLFKSEQKKFQQGSSASKTFKIDTNLLNLALKSIPFNQRHDIKGVEWVNGELEEMKREAQLLEEDYKTALAKAPEPEPTIEKQVKHIPEPSTTTPSAKSPKSKPATEKESMQNWLDDILDL